MFQILKENLPIFIIFYIKSIHSLVWSFSFIRFQSNLMQLKPQEIGRAGRDGLNSTCRIYWAQPGMYNISSYFILCEYLYNQDRKLQYVL